MPSQTGFPLSESDISSKCRLADRTWLGTTSLGNFIYELDFDMDTGVVTALEVRMAFVGLAAEYFARIHGHSPDQGQHDTKETREERWPKLGSFSLTAFLGMLPCNDKGVTHIKNVIDAFNRATGKELEKEMLTE